MPASDRSTESTRGPKTICIPCSQKQYGRIVDDPVLFRGFLDQQIKATPELFSPEIQRGYRMKDLYTLARRAGDAPNRPPQRRELLGSPLLLDAVSVRPH